MYRAVIILGSTSISEMFATVAAAENWLDSYNNNHEHPSFIQVLDKDYKVRDSFYYTK